MDGWAGGCLFLLLFKLVGFLLEFYAYYHELRGLHIMVTDILKQFDLSRSCSCLPFS